MDGRISEYISAGKLNGTDLMDLSVVDGASPTGYSTRKATINAFLNDFPTLYSGSGTLDGNRTINQDGFSLFFNSGDWGVDFANNGIMFDNLTKRVGFGEGTPLAKVHIKGGVGDDLMLIEDAVGVDFFEIESTGITRINKNGKQTYIGDLVNYFYQYQNISTQYSSSATYTGFHSNRDGSGISMRGTSVDRQHIDSTGDMVLGVDWDNNPSASVGTEVIRLKKNTNINMPILPTSSAGLVAGDLWNNAGVINIV